MDNKLIPIDTEYKGYYFRSRLEARWAVFFDALGWPWRYEHEGFELPSGRYLPDFYFPDIDCYAEVKPKELTGEELNKCIELSKCNNKIIHQIDIILLEGEPHWKSYRTLSNGDEGCDVIFMPLHDKFYPFFYSSSFDKKYMYETSMAVKKAKSARFEFEWKEL